MGADDQLRRAGFNGLTGLSFLLDGLRAGQQCHRNAQGGKEAGKGGKVLLGEDLGGGH